MSNLTTELQKKAASLDVERDKLFDQINAKQARLVAIEEALAGIEKLLHLEGIIMPDSAKESRKGWTLADFIKEIMADGKLHTTDDLIKSIKSMGYDFREKSPYRSVNFTLMGLQRGGNFERKDDGWRFVG